MNLFSEGRQQYFSKFEIQDFMHLNIQVGRNLGAYALAEVACERFDLWGFDVAGSGDYQVPTPLIEWAQAELAGDSQAPAISLSTPLPLAA